jgi:hypothetical protein
MLAGNSLTKADVVFSFSPQPDDYVTETGAVLDHRGSLTREGITATFTGHSDDGLFSTLGKVSLSSSGIGVSIEDAANNDASRIDLSMSDEFGPVNERLLFSFDQTVKLTSISLNGLGDGSLAELISAPESSAINAGFFTGSASVIDSYDLSSSSIILAADQKIGVGYLSGSGFQIDSFTVSAIPEPSGTGLVLLAFCCNTLRRKRTMIVPSVGSSDATCMPRKRSV